MPCLLPRCTVLIDSLRAFFQVSTRKRNPETCLSCSSLNSSSPFLSPFRLFSPCFSRILWVQASFGFLRPTPSKSSLSSSSSSLCSFRSSPLLFSTSLSSLHLFCSSSLHPRDTSSSPSARAMSSSSSTSVRPKTHIPPDPPPPASLLSPSSSDRKKRAREEEQQEEKEKEGERPFQQDATKDVTDKKNEEQSSLPRSLLAENEASRGGGVEEEEGEQGAKKINKRKEEEQRGARRRRIAPLSIVTWNVNSLPSRIRQPWLWTRFVDWLHAVEPVKRILLCFPTTLPPSFSLLSFL